MRLQKILSAAGIASRRAAETLIAQGRVTVNGQTVTELGTKADPERDDIRVDGRRVKGAQRRRYILLYKPRGYITSRSDPQQRPTVIDLLAKGGVRDYVYPVGRLDYDSEGLLILTSDGELAAQLTHPRHGVEREYEVRVRGVPDEHELERLSRGVSLDGRRTAPARGRADEGDRSGERPAGAAVDRDPRGAQPAGPQDVRRDRPPGRPAAPRAHRPDHRRAHPAGGVPRADAAGSRDAAQAGASGGDGLPAKGDSRSLPARAGSHADRSLSATSRSRSTASERRRRATA